MDRLGYPATAYKAPVARLDRHRDGPQAPGQIIGVHGNGHITLSSDDPNDFAGLTEAEQARLARMQHFRDEMMGFNIVQSTRPQTIAHALHDSPVGPARLDGREVQGMDRSGR
jgi:hypothetical protein